MGYPQEVLKRYFGYHSFRPGQGEVVERLLRGEDVLSVMPTGAGKSICYQVPALCLPGITLVVSPLISLMQDQVKGLIQAGVPAAYLNSSLTERWRLDQLDSFGVLAGMSREAVTARIRLLLEEECLVQSEGQYPTLALGPEARRVMRGETTLTARIREETRPARAPEPELVPVSQELYDRLVALRTRLANRAGVPAYVIFPNQSLREMCQRLPRDEGELLQVSGVGSQKLKRFGKDFLAVIEEWRQEHP